MDDRQVSHQVHQRQPPEALFPGRILAQRLYMVGSQQHQALVAEGHYRCAVCRRVDTMEVNAHPVRPSR
jgi:hypothetical protein